MTVDDGDNDDDLPKGAILNTRSCTHRQLCHDDYDAGVEQIDKNSGPSSPAAILEEASLGDSDNSNHNVQPSEFRHLEENNHAASVPITPPVPFDFVEHEKKEDIRAMEEKIATHITHGARVPATPTPFNFVEFEDDDDGAVMKQQQDLRLRSEGVVSRTIPVEEHEKEGGADAEVREAPTRSGSHTEGGNAEAQRRIVDAESNTNRGESDTRTREAQARSESDAEEGSNGEAQRQTSLDIDTTGNQRSQNGSDALNASSGARNTFLGRASSMLVARVNSTVEQLITAILVEEEEPVEVFLAEPVSYFERKWKPFACAMCFLLVVLSVFLGVYLNSDAHKKNEVVDHYIPASDVPSMPPSSPPSFDLRPMLEIVQERGYVRCGLREAIIESVEGFQLSLCRAVAVVIFGNPDNYEPISATKGDRFQLLNDRSFDVLISGDTHTVEREIQERSTGSGFTFSSPYYYDGMAYMGYETFVRCAENRTRFGECSSLRICVTEKTSCHDYVESSFPSDFYEYGSSLDELTEMLLNDECNVIATKRSLLMDIIATMDDSRLVLGDKLMTKEPLCVVTRKNDREFSDIVNWVVQALFYGDEQGLSKNSSLCQNYSDSTSNHALELNFMNAVYCMGTYSELCGKQNHRGMNQINNGTSGMMFTIPFGELDHADVNVEAGDLFFINGIRKKGSLNCGVVVPDGFEGKIKESDGLMRMSIEYCRTLGAAFLNGDYTAVSLTTFSENDNSSFAALNNGTIDVLAGKRVKKKYDFGSAPSSRGFEFSTPYYYGNEKASDDVSFFSLATRGDDMMLSSFVNCVVLATIYAMEEGVTREGSDEMPLVSVFGSDYKWALRDAIAYSGSYHQMYAKSFGDFNKKDRGRNDLNRYGGPQIHSLPGLSP